MADLVKRNAKMARLEAARKRIVARGREKMAVNGRKAMASLSAEMRSELGRRNGTTVGNRMWTCKCGREIKSYIAYWNHAKKCHAQVRQQEPKA